MSTPHQDQAYYRKGFSKAISDTHNWRSVENAVPFIIPYLKKNQKLLDVGCGPGSISKDLANYVSEVVGLETGEELLQIARSQCSGENVKFEIGSVYSLPFNDNEFDVVLASQVVVHLEDPVTGLKEMARVCKPGGFVCVKNGDIDMTTVYPEKYAPAIRDAMLSMIPTTTSKIAGRELVAKSLEAGYEKGNITYSTSTWSVGDHDGRVWWADMHIGRLNESNELDHEKDKRKIDAAVDAWKQWAEDDAGVLLFVHGEIVYKKPA
ncbi:hypothetical protein DICA1_A00386 [Diutina catenulata]